MRLGRGRHTPESPANAKRRIVKSPILADLAILAMIAAALVAPVGVRVAAIAFVVTGVLAVVMADYGRDLRPVRARGRLVPFGGAARGGAEFDEAA